MYIFELKDRENCLSERETTNLTNIKRACKNKQCVNNDKFCDEQRNCFDSSDEVCLEEQRTIYSYTG